MKILKKYLKIGLLVCLFFLPVCLVLASITSTPNVNSLDIDNPLTSKTITISTQAEFDAASTALDGNSSVNEDILIDPIEPITGQLGNFTQDLGFNLEFSVNCNNTCDITLYNIMNQGAILIAGSPTVRVQLVLADNNFYVDDSPNLTVSDTIIDNPLTVDIDIVGTAVVLFEDSNITGTLEVTGADATVTATFDNVTVDGKMTIQPGNLATNILNCLLKGDLEVKSTSTTTIQNTNILGTLIDNIDPTLTPDSNSYSITYSFVFESNAQVNMQWTGSDNIVGAGYEVSYNITIYKDNVKIDSVVQTTTTYQLDIKTASSYRVEIVAIDFKLNTSTTAVITITPVPDVLLFVLMIIIIAGAAVGVFALLYLRKQRQWQKTSLMEIPT